MSLNMLIETGVRLHRRRLSAAGWPDTGFSESYVEHLVGPDSMVVGIK